jgi:phosphoglycolate phosphatase
MAKPDPGHLTGVIALAGGDASRAVMIGDSDVDLRTAKAAGVPVMLVSFGYAVTPLDGLEAEAVIGHFDQLAASAASLLNPKDRRHARS